MRLLRTDTTKLKFDEILSKPPPYAILSHRWRDKEVDYPEIVRGHASDRRLWKILCTCAKAKGHNFTRVWIDTCCIDKANHTEFSETITSMFVIYMQSAVCYVYMDDVPSADEDHAAPGSHFRRSEWFKRGWTLQELLAPRNIIFYSKDWIRIGTKESLVNLLSDITHIHPRVLVPPGQDRAIRRVLDKVCIAERMSWAAGRDTTKGEDRAYSLMGIFNVHMSILYGEGAESAFKRLQQHIIMTSHDQTIFAWRMTVHECGLLASSPDNFSGGSKLHRIPRQQYETMLGIHDSDPTYTTTNYGVGIELPLQHYKGDIQIGYLAVGHHDHPGRALGLFFLPQQFRAVGHYVRTTSQSGSYYATGGAKVGRGSKLSKIYVGECGQPDSVPIYRPEYNT